MSLREKGTILEFEHKVVRDIKLYQKQYPQAMIDIKINLMADSLVYNEDHHKKMIKELEEVIRRYI
jgi:hypothetical protein